MIRSRFDLPEPTSMESAITSEDCGKASSIVMTSQSPNLVTIFKWPVPFKFVIRSDTFRNKMKAYVLFKYWRRLGAA